MHTKSNAATRGQSQRGSLELFVVESNGTNDPMALLQGYVPADLAAAFVAAARAAGVNITIR